MEREIEEKVLSLLQNRFQLTNGNFSKCFVNGGSLNETYQVVVNGKKAFCKVNSANKFPQLFARERKGLELLAANGITTPEIFDCFVIENSQVLLMEWIEPGERTVEFWQNFGRELAAMHAVKAPEFGWIENNYMGVVPQSNRNHRQWTEFFRDERLEPLCNLCFDKGLLLHHRLQNFEKLYGKLVEIFGDSTLPSLVRGDLWNGNFIAGVNDKVVLVDPAVYFGHHSADLGMTTLFGGFPGMFYDSYQYYFPFPVNYRQQWKVANLYPLLIHLYLFGRSYLNEIEQTLSEFE